MSDANKLVTVSEAPPPRGGDDHARVIVVGGGLAGLAAASALAGKGLRTTLLESRPRLGGRASSFTDPSTGELIDNCQHVSMGCCTNLADFCERVGTRDLFLHDREIVFLSPEGRISHLNAGWLPAPFHLTGSLLSANYLTWSEKLRLAYGMMCLRFASVVDSGEDFQHWLRRHGQSERLIERFWGTVLVSALNERLENMDIGHARKVFLEGFLQNKSGYVLEIPIVPLGELYGSRLEEWLSERGIEVRLGTGVRSIDLDEEGAVKGVTLRSGEQLAADFVVSTVPFDRIAGLLPEQARKLLPQLSRVGEFQASPITGVHLWFDTPVCPFAHVVTVGRLVQWVFNHSELQGRGSKNRAGQYLQVVISASYDLVGMDKSSILDAVLKDLAAMWPVVGEAKLERWWVVTEHGATFSVRPGVDRLRPSQRTEVSGLYLAGDWTDTGWPATMEGAVRAGYLAAEGVLNELGRPETVLKDDLPPTFLARWLLGTSERRGLRHVERPRRARPQTA